MASNEAAVAVPAGTRWTEGDFAQPQTQAVCGFGERPVVARERGVAYVRLPGGLVMPVPATAGAIAGAFRG
jgi:hypothetical protein